MRLGSPANPSAVSQRSQVAPGEELTSLLHDLRDECEVEGELQDGHSHDGGREGETGDAARLTERARDDGHGQGGYCGGNRLLLRLHALGALSWLSVTRVGMSLSRAQPIERLDHDGEDADAEHLADELHDGHVRARSRPWRRQRWACR